jgi:signal recognition particle subunit SRP54
MGGGPMPMQMPQLAPGYTAPMGQAAMAKARLMGYSNQPAMKGTSEKEREALKKKRKQEKAARKKNRKK